jgi:hypothetical protein
MMNGREKVNAPNKAGRPAAEARERRAGTEGKAGQHDTHRALNRERVTQALDRLRQAISPSNTQGGSRMQESCTYGSVRGAPSNGRPYRDPRATSRSSEMPFASQSRQ